jgi:hypothetical protein
MTSGSPCFIEKQYFAIIRRAMASSRWSNDMFFLSEEKLIEYFNVSNDMINIVEGGVNADSSRTTYERPLQGGLAIGTSSSSSTCTGGFSAESFPNAALKYYITAAHCGDLYDTFYQGGSSFGDMVKYKYGGSVDAGAIVIDSSDASALLYTTYEGARSFTSVNSRNFDLSVGDTICISGKTSGFDCDSITSTSVSGSWEKDGQYYYFSGLVGGGYSSVGGDSGGPLFFSNELYGVNKGYIYKDGVRVSVFSHVSDIMSAFTLQAVLD